MRYLTVFSLAHHVKVRVGSGAPQWYYHRMRSLLYVYSCVDLNNEGVECLEWNKGVGKGNQAKLIFRLQNDVTTHTSYILVM